MSCEGSTSCKYPVVNKKYKLCKKHNWERMNPGKDFYQEANRKQLDTKNKMVEKQLAKPKKIVKQKKIKKRTTKRQRQENEYSTKSKPEYIKEHPYCEVCLDEGITREVYEIHHKKGKEEGLLNDKRYFLSVCRPHHEWIGDNPNIAKEKGYSINRTT